MTELNLDNCRATQIEGLTEEYTNLQLLSMISVGLTRYLFLITLFKASQFRETIFLQLESVGRFSIQLRSVHLTTAIRKHLKIGFVLCPKLEKVDIRFSIGVEKRFDVIKVWLLCSFSKAQLLFRMPFETIW